MTRADLDASLLRATELLTQGEVDACLDLMAELEEAVTDPPLAAEVWARYASIFGALELSEEMQGAVHRALMFDPNNARANYLMGVQQMVDQRYADAVASLHKAASLYPAQDRYHLAEVYGNLGYCHDLMGDKARAEFYWEMAEDLDPGSEPDEVADDDQIAPPPVCGALERVEATLRQMGALRDDESLFDEPGKDGGADEEEDDDYWRIDDEPAPKVNGSTAGKKALASKGLTAATPAAKKTRRGPRRKKA